MTLHSKLPPSSAARRVACPGSRWMEEQYPAEDSEASREGERAHEICKYMLLEGGIIKESQDTDEMIEGAKLYAAYVTSWNNGSELHIEERVSMTSIHPDSFGTPDCWWFDKILGQIHIVDYKYGFGFVEVFENWQLISYAAGVLEALKIDGIQDQHITVHLHIVQPRSYHPDGQCRKWSIRASELRPYFNTLRNIEALASKDGAMTLVSPECVHCSARHMCKTLQVETARRVDIAHAASPINPTGELLGKELKVLREAAMLLDARITGLTEEALVRIKRGESIANYHAEHSVGREVWKSPIEEIITLGEMMGIDLSKPLDVITPKQAIKAGLPDNLVRSYSETTRGAMRLVESNGRKVFGGG